MCEEYSLEKIPLIFESKPIDNALKIFFDPLLYSSDNKET